jgi:DNA-binding phage protein
MTGVGMIELYPLDVAGLPNDEEAQVTFLADAIDREDPEKIAHAAAILAQARGLHEQTVAPGSKGATAGHYRPASRAKPMKQ